MQLETHPKVGLPRVRLAQLPTPVEPLPNLSKHLGGPELWVKRDDQTGLATGGNKVRKLEFLMASAIQAGADCVITAGSTQSNHARQTAAAAARCGMESHLVLYSPDGRQPHDVNGNLLLIKLMGASVHWTTERAPYRDTIEQVRNELEAQGRRPHVIPYGGSNPVGAMGYLTAMLELADQESETGPLDAVVFATSSGGTQAGMVLGAHRSGLAGRVRLVGISVDESAETLGARVGELASEADRAFGLNLGIAEQSLPQIARGAASEVVDGYRGGGYAVIGEGEREAIHLAARLEGLLVDPVYTGRALAGLIDLIRTGKFAKSQRVLFWHTGGAAALFAYARDLSVEQGAGATS